jgi:cell pole-organizing protein PopZ
MDARNEPSMEEILASIKRIIAEDGGPGPSAARGRLVRPVKQKERAMAKTPLAIPPIDDEAGAEIAQAEVLELTQAMPDTAPVTESESDAARAAPEPAFQAGIVSEDATHASRQALSALSAMIVKPSSGSDNSLEGLVRDMLRPILKEWLDAKLPEMVEALVAQEIARISGRSL